MGTEKPNICRVFILPSVERNAEMIIGAAQSNKNAMSVKSLELVFVFVLVVLIFFWVLEYIHYCIFVGRYTDYHVDCD